MTTLIKNAVCLDLFGTSAVGNVLVKGNKVAYVGTELPNIVADDIVDGTNCILIPGFVNAHCHTPMTLLRGIGSDCPLDVWLNDHIFPAEDKLNDELAYIGTMNAIAEMIRGGVVSFTDMYFFCDKIAEGVIESGMKANISRSIVSFDESEDPADNFRVAETVSLIKEYNNVADGRVKVDVSLHAEYTNTKSMCRYAGMLAKQYGVGMQIHLSETEKEHNECMVRRAGMTPTEFFADCGVFDVPTNAAHCVWITEKDMEILAEHKVSIAHNPRSNLKLGSGVMSFDDIKRAGINISLGTDGSASNNKQSLIDEMQLCAILHKGIAKKADIVTAADAIYSATAGGKISQGRDADTNIHEGMIADLVLINCDRPGVSSAEAPVSTLAYTTDRSDVVMTMVDGRILFNRGEYNTIDIEKLTSEYKSARKKLFS